MKDCCYYFVPNSVQSTGGLQKKIGELVPTLQELTALCWETKTHPNETNM